MAYSYKDRLVTTVSAVASAGAGAFTISTASSSYQTFGAGDDGLTFEVTALEGTAWEVFEGTYTHSGTSLSRGTLIASSTGSRVTFTTAAVLTATPSAASVTRFNFAALEHVVGTDADTTMAVGTLYIVDMSAWATADRTYTLPATAAVGSRVGIMVTAGDASHELIIKPNTGDTINGGSAAAEWSRLFITGEVVILRCVTADSAWIVEEDGRIPMSCFARLSTSATGETAGTDTFPTDKSGAWTSVLDRGNILTTSTGTVTNRRACKGNVLFGGVSVNSIGVGNYFQVGIYVAGAVALGPFLRSALTAGVIVQGSVQVYDFPIDTATRMFYQSGEGSKGLRGTGDISSSFGFLEVL
jgi:hypothetical protein